MAHLNSKELDLSTFDGPLLDDCAPYSGLGIHELKSLAPLISPNWNGDLDPIPEGIEQFQYWQYGSGSHSSECRKILGSVMLQAMSDQGKVFSVRHVVIEGSSQWVIGRNVTRHCNIIHIDQCALLLPGNERQTVAILDKVLQSHLPFAIFIREKQHPADAELYGKAFCATLTVHSSSTPTKRPWSELKRIVDKVHHHVCGHSNYEDIKLLLQRNKVWSDDVKLYFSETLDTCSACTAVKAPKGERPMSLSSMSRQFNDTVCVDHFFIEGKKVFHAIDSTVRYSAGDVVDDTKMENAIVEFENHWVNPFWYPSSVLYDPAFKNEEFHDYLGKVGVTAKPLPPRRHNKNVLESKHRVIRDIFYRLKEANEDDDSATDQMLIVQSIRISNDLYGNDILSANELAKGYTRHVSPGQAPLKVPQELIEAQKEVIARRKLTLTMHSKAVKDISISVGDLVQVFIKQQFEKRGKWLSSRPVLSYDCQSRTVTVAGSNGRTTNAAIEDVRPAMPVNELALAVQESIDEIDAELDWAFAQDDCEDQDVQAPLQKHVRFADEIDPPEFNPEASSCNLQPPLTRQDHTKSMANDYQDSVEIDRSALQYIPPPRPSLGPAVSVHPMTTRQKSNLEANEVELSPGTELTSIEQDATENYFARFKSKEFLLHQAEGLPSFVTENAYGKEEKAIKRHVRDVHRQRVPRNANVITSHVLYKIKTLDDKTRMCKARIAPHGNKDKEKENLKTDSKTCPPVGFRILLSLCVLFNWALVKVDVKSAFLQTGAALRDVYVVPPRECKTREFYWLLLSASYGLVNANAKWQQHSDDFLRTEGFTQLVHVPQLFYKRMKGNLSILAVKVVDDIAATGPIATVNDFVARVSKKYEVGTIVRGPGTFKFNGVTVTQHEDGTVTVSGDDKLNELKEHSHLSQRRQQLDEALNLVEGSIFASVNGSLGYIGMSASPFCSFATSYLQQRNVRLTVKDLICQNNMLRKLQKLGSNIHFCRPLQKGSYKPTIVVFADAGRPNECGQLGFIVGLMFGSRLMKGAVFHILNWSSHKSSRPVRSTAAAETLAAGYSVDEGKILVEAYQQLLGLQIDLIIVVDSQDLYDSLSTCRTPADKSIKADVALIRYEFETEKIKRMVWVPGTTNLADPLTKPDCALSNALQLCMETGSIPIAFPGIMSRNSNMFLG